MLPLYTSGPEPGSEKHWQRLLAEAVRTPAELCRRLALPPTVASQRAGDDFPLLVPQPFLSRMRPGDPHDPLLRQVLPLDEELRPQDGFSHDPLLETQYSPQPGVIHKYHGRALMILGGTCAVHCRYCFRRHFPHSGHRHESEQWRQALEYLQAHPQVEEVIWSGGDPLTLSDRRLGLLARSLAAIPSLRRLRIHTRLPVVIPSRITAECLAWMTENRLQVVVVVHCNHPNELDEPAQRSLRRLRQAGLTVLNQSVLLKGVNDDARTLARLSERLFDCGALPYYLHMLDQVAGASHFRLELAEARKLAGAMAARLPGYLVPRLVQELPGLPAKQPIAPHWD